MFDLLAVCYASLFSQCDQTKFPAFDHTFLFSSMQALSSADLQINHIIIDTKIALGALAYVAFIIYCYTLQLLSPLISIPFLMFIFLPSSSIFCSCLVACIGQFYPGKLPDTFWPVLACVVSYFTLSMALTAYTTFIEKDTIAQTRGQADLIIRSKMPRFQDVYTLGIRPRGSKADSPEEVKLASSVGAYFDSEGILAVDAFKGEVLALLGRLTASSARGEAKKSQ